MAFSQKAGDEQISQAPPSLPQAVPASPGSQTWVDESQQPAQSFVGHVPPHWSSAPTHWPLQFSAQGQQLPEEGLVPAGQQLAPAHWAEPPGQHVPVGPPQQYAEPPSQLGAYVMPQGPVSVVVEHVVGGSGLQQPFS